MAITITITITSKSVIDYTQLQLQLSITPCLISTASVSQGMLENLIWEIMLIYS